MKLWEKGIEMDQFFEKFSIGQDQILDLELAYFDVIGTISHVKMLGKIELLSSKEVDVLIEALESIKATAEQGTFEIEPGIEDCHSQIELLLTRSLGETGKKVHAGRSRNDQVLTALKLFTKHKIEHLALRVHELFDMLLKKSNQYQHALMPGYTHMQVAMPSSFGLWFGAYAESLSDDMVQLIAAHKFTDKNPLGSGAGYGSSFPLDREFTTEDLGFDGMNVNVVYAQMTRGKLEKTVSNALAGIAATLSKFAMDICIYSGQNFKFFKLDSRFTSGSSIMPHKQNPDGFELVRAKCNQIQALPYELSLILNNLPSGYHRDLQVLKEHYLPSFKTLQDCLEITIAMIENLNVNESLVNDARYDLLYTVEEVNALVLSGTPFRDAYQQVGQKVLSGNYESKKKLSHTHIGSLGNLGNERIQEDFKKEWAYFAEKISPTSHE